MRKVTLQTPISLADLRDMSTAGFGELLSDGSRQQDLWGINLYPDLPEEEWLEFDSMINMRPSSGNRSRSVEDPAIRACIAEHVGRLVRR